jgi:hypothetical protein
MAGKLLGCGVNTASIWDRLERRKLVDLDDVTCLEYSRELDDLSDATVTVGREGECCAVLDQVRSWRHALLIHRDGQLAWSGPILRPEYATTETVISAVDRGAWLDRRLVRTTREECGGLTDITRAVIEEALTHPDGAADETGLEVEYRACTHTDTCREFEACRSTSAAELRNLARGPLNFTVLGRKMLVWCGSDAIGRTAMLQDKDFMGELTVIEDGYQLATAVCVQGDGVQAYCGGTDPYYGLVEVTIKDDSITTAAAAMQLACQEVAARSQPPLVLSVPDGIRLDPRAPVSFDELVPGVTIPVWSSATCRTVQQDMALTRVRVRQGCSDEGGEEEVSVTVAPVASIGTEGEAV